MADFVAFPVNFVHQFEALASLEKDDRPITKGDKFAVDKAPSNFLSRIFQAISRGSSQSIKNNITAIENTVKDALGRLNKIDEQKLSNLEIYQHVQALRDMQAHVNKSITKDKGLSALDTTIKKGKSWFVRPRVDSRKENHENLKSVISNIKDNLQPVLEAKIEALEAQHYAQDVVATLGVLQHLYGKVPKGITPPQDHQPLSKFAVEETLGRIYGKRVVSEMLELYQFTNQHTFSVHHLKILMVGIVANLTLEDVSFFLKNVKDLSLDEIFSNQDFDELASGELTENKLARTVMALRNIDPTIINPPAKKSRLAPKQRVLQFSSDSAFLRSLGHMKEYGPHAQAKEQIKDLGKFRYTEYLSREIAYAWFNIPKAKFSKGVLVPMYDQNMKLVCKQANTVFSKDGLHALSLLPTVPPEDEDEKVHIPIVFRGTWCGSSIWRDLSLFEKETLNFEGPGRKSFNREKIKILTEVHNHIDAYSKQINRQMDVVLEPMGHSLGASDAQRFVEDVAKDLAKEEVKDKEDKPWQKTKIMNSKGYKVTGVRLFGFNPPAVEHDVARSFMESANKLKDVSFKIRYFKTHHDGIAKAGRVWVGYRDKDLPPLKNIKITNIKFTHITKHKGNPIIRFINRSFEAHCRRCMWIHEELDPKLLNSSYVSYVRTNNKKDAKIRVYNPYANSLEDGGMLSPRILNKWMATPAGNFVGAFRNFFLPKAPEAA